MSVDLLQKELVAEYEAIALKKDPELLAIERSLESGRVDADSLDVMRSMGSGLTATKGASGGYFIAPRLSIKDAAEESNRVFEALQTWNERQAAKVQPQQRRTELKLARLGRVRAARRDLVLLTVEKFLDCFGSRRQTAGVPPGYLDIMRGFKDTMREVAALATNATVDPAAESGCHGSLALGMAFGTRHLASDLSPFGVWQAFLGDLFSNVSGITGDTSCMHTLHLQSMEVAWSASSYMLIHSAQGLGKSVRLAKIKRLHVEGWVMSSGDGSACSGANGGLEYTCGRLLTFDEIPKAFYSRDSEQIEKLKSAATDNFVSTQRTAKVSVGRGGGAESFKTVHMTTHRMETYCMATNAGPCLNKEKGEPDGDKIPLIDRCHSHMVFAQESVEPMTDEEWAASLTLPQNRIKIAKYRLVSCLTCVILMLLKHSPWLVPDLTYAKAVCTRLDRIVESRFNLPRPSPRKISKRNFTLLHLTVESAVASLLWSIEGIKANMPCLAQEHLVPFDPSQIVPYISGNLRIPRRSAS